MTVLDKFGKSCLPYILILCILKLGVIFLHVWDKPVMQLKKKKGAVYKLYLDFSLNTTSFQCNVYLKVIFDMIFTFLLACFIILPQLYFLPGFINVLSASHLLIRECDQHPCLMAAEISSVSIIESFLFFSQARHDLQIQTSTEREVQLSRVTVTISKTFHLHIE